MALQAITREFALYVQFGKEHLQYLKTLFNPGACILMRKNAQLYYKWKTSQGHKAFSDWRKGARRNVYCYSPDQQWFFFGNISQQWCRVPDFEQEQVEELWKKAKREVKPQEL